MALTYTQLNQAIQDYTENQESSFLAHIPDFVMLAEENIYRSAKLPVQSKVASLTATPNTNTITLPSDFLAFDWIYVSSAGTNTILLPKEVDFIYQAYPSSTYYATPIYYALQDDYTMVLGPTPDQAYTFSYKYTYVPASIVSSSTSWLGNNAENALLYGSLIHAYAYMKGEDSLVQKYQSLYEDALGMAKHLGEGLDRSDASRTPPPRDLPNGGN